uniref:Uncharacterized protein n=1 Tax=Arundo donax TaxID=35708 RepID=A0A0A9BB45_ARUDO
MGRPIDWLVRLNRFASRALVLAI